MTWSRVVLLGAGAASMLSLAGAASSHTPAGCGGGAEAAVGSADRVYAIPHGCIRLSVPADDTQLPTVVVRQHKPNGRVLTRRFPVPATNLDRANGSLGTCGRDSTYLFIVRYPFVTVVAQQLFPYGSRATCSTDFSEALLWTLQLSTTSPTLRGHWFTHRP